MASGFLVSVTDAAASAVFQTMLTVCHRKRPKLCKQLLKRIMEYLSNRSAAPGVRSESTEIDCVCIRTAGRHHVTFYLLLPSSPLLVFLKDQASSHLIDTIIQLAHKSLLCGLYKNHLKGQLVDLALHPIANFPVQRLTAASAKYKLVGDDAPCWPQDEGLDSHQYLFLSVSLSEVPDVV